MGSYCLMGTEFQFHKVKNVLKRDGGERSKQCDHVYCLGFIHERMVTMINLMLSLLHHSLKISNGKNY